MTDAPDGMIELWTIEQKQGNDLYIEDLVETEAEAQRKLAQRDNTWATQRIVVPYSEALKKEQRRKLGL